MRSFLLLLVSACDPSSSDIAQTDYSLQACPRAAHLAEILPAQALPAAATELLHRGCDPAPVCDVLLGERLPRGDNHWLSQAIQILDCLQSVDPSQLDPAPFMAPNPEKGAPYTYVGLIDGLPYAVSSVATTPLGSGSASFVLPDGTRFATVQTLRGGPLSAVSAVAGGPTGVYRTLDGGGNWFWSSGPGSGLEATTKNAQAMVRTLTPQGGTDLLVGIVGTTNGGVYLSGDGGEDWTQINLGFDPNSLNITTLAKTSCSGCPVQYYSGTYGSGTYTRTIAVVAPPAVTGWCFGSTSCACGTSPPGGPSAGGQPFKICGANFQPLARVQLGSDGARLNAAGCTTVSSGAIACTRTPAGVGVVPLRVVNPDTRAGVAGAVYSYN